MPQPPDSLTPREKEVLALLRRGLTNEEIAQRLGISLDGAKYHVSQILSKLGVATREEAAALTLPERRRWWAAWPLWAKIAGATSAAAGAGLTVLAGAAIWTGEPVEEIAGEQIASPTDVASPTSPINPTLAPLPEGLSAKERELVVTVLEGVKGWPCDHPDASSAKATLTTMDGFRRMVKERLDGEVIPPGEKPQRLGAEVSNPPPPPDDAPVWVVEIRHDASARLKPGNACEAVSRSVLWLTLIVDGEVYMGYGGN